MKRLTKNRPVRKWFRYVYRFSATLYGDKVGRNRKQMTIHPKFTVYGNEHMVTDYAETDEKAWEVFKTFLQEQHPGEGVCVISIERETWWPFGSFVTHNRLYFREHWRDTRRPEAFPERMPG